MEREIWFKRILWSYIPINWKGFSVTAGIIAIILTGFFLAQSALDAFGYKDAFLLPFLVFFLPGWLSLMIIAHRHS
ncbi:hypothetical protein EAH79_13765 [Sphingomonas koreensis]|nr:hypothetical protein EAH79_13765 [Sphingomonas koreensis]